MSMPGFSGEMALFKTAVCYRVATTWSTVSESHLGPAQFLRPPGDGGIGGSKGCTNQPVDASECATRCKRTCVINGEITESCVSASNCFPVSCGPCLLPTDNIRLKLLAGQPIDPATDLIFSQKCTQGANTFTQNCVKCSGETKITGPLGFCKSISVCMGGFDPGSISILTRDC